MGSSGGTGTPSSGDYSGQSTAGDTGASSTGASDYTSAGGAYTRPMSAGETPSSTGGYGASMSSGESTPPPSGGYTPPPSGGGGAGGYTPPPPPSGGYSAPPPPPSGGYGPPTATGAGASDFGHLPQSYINAVTKPSAGTYEAEIPNASWVKTLIGVAAVAVVTFLVNLIFAGTTAATLRQLQDQLSSSGQNVDLTPYTNAVGTAGGFGSLIGTFISFFLGAGLLFLLARLFGGKGSDFMTHSYLLSLSYTPLRLVAAVLSIIPCIGAIASLVLTLYQLYSAGLAMQASQRMEAGRAQMAAFLGLVIVLVLACLGLFLCAGLLAAALGGASTTNP
jgi:hypothetical protein